MQNLRREILADDTCVLTFDRSSSSANIFDRTTLEELGGQLDALAANPTARALVLISAKESIFVAGADLHGIRGMGPAELDSFIELGQEVFNKLAALRIPTVAAIHGAAVGGGYEVALACDWRVASPDACTKIGLPETQPGIIPAWGGSTRLPGSSASPPRSISFSRQPLRRSTRSLAWSIVVPRQPVRRRARPGEKGAPAPAHSPRHRRGRFHDWSARPLSRRIACTAITRPSRRRCCHGRR